MSRWLEFTRRRLTCAVRGHVEARSLVQAEPARGDSARTRMVQKSVCSRCFSPLEPMVQAEGKFPRPR